MDKDIYLEINGKPVPLRKLPCAKCEYRYSIVCPQCDWNKDSKYNTYKEYKQEGETEMLKDKEETQVLNNRKLIAYVSEHGIKKKWLADKIGMSYGSLFYILKGQTKLRTEDAKLIAHALNVELDAIID